MHKHRVSGSSLLITVVMATVIGLICLLLILLAYNNRRVGADFRIGQKLGRDLASSVSLVLAHDLTGTATADQAVDLFGNGRDSLYVREGPWGLYNIVRVEVVDNGRKKSTLFFKGSALPDTLDGCLYLVEHRRPLSLVGATRLTGKAYLPGSGVRPGTMNQRGYDYSVLIDGRTVESRDTLPGIDLARIQYYGRLIGRIDSSGVIDEVPGSVERSFADTTVVIHKRGRILLDGQVLRGRVMVISDSCITIGSSAKLDNIIIVAPVIRFEAGFSGRVQAFGTDSITAGDHCQFTYPSSLVLIKMGGENVQPGIYMGRGCQLDGVVMSYAADSRLKTYAEIKEGSQIRGVVYTAGYLCLRGVVFGCVLTDYFIYRTPSVVYDNYLADVWIERARLHAYFVGPGLFMGRRKNRVLQWVK